MANNNGNKQSELCDANKWNPIEFGREEDEERKAENLLQSKSKKNEVQKGFNENKFKDIWTNRNGKETL